MKLLEVSAKARFELELLYSDFVKVRVDLKPLLARGKVFTPLRDVKTFKRAKVSEAGDAVTWGDVDLDAKALRGNEGGHIILEKTNLLSSEVARVMLERGLTQGELAKAIGTKQPNIARLLSQDYQGHSVTTLQKIAEATGKKLEIRFVD